MVPIENYKPFETDIWFYAEEGTATKYTGTDKEEVLVMSAEVHKGDYVTLDSADKTIKVAGAEDPVIVQVIDNPIWRKDRPNATSSTGTYNKRICTVRLFGYYVHNVELKAENSAISVGDKVVYKGNNVFDKDNTNGKAIALVSAGAGSKKKIPVLMQLIGF